MKKTKHTRVRRTPRNQRVPRKGRTSDGSVATAIGKLRYSNQVQSAIRMMDKFEAGDERRGKGAVFNRILDVLEQEYRALDPQIKSDLQDRATKTMRYAISTASEQLKSTGIPGIKSLCLDYYRCLESIEHHHRHDAFSELMVPTILWVCRSPRTNALSVYEPLWLAPEDVIRAVALTNLATCLEQSIDPASRASLPDADELCRRQGCGSMDTMLSLWEEAVEYGGSAWRNEYDRIIESTLADWKEVADAMKSPSPAKATRNTPQRYGVTLHMQVLENHRQLGLLMFWSYLAYWRTPRVNYASAYGGVPAVANAYYFGNVRPGAGNPLNAYRGQSLSVGDVVEVTDYHKATRQMWLCRIHDLLPVPATYHQAVLENDLGKLATFEAPYENECDIAKENKSILLSLPGNEQSEGSSEKADIATAHQGGIRP